MNATTRGETPLTNRGSVTTEGLQEYLSCGRAAAVELGKKANARIQIGRRVLWNTAKVQRYLDSVSE